ncbi:MAG: DUF1501 domain-containing protein [Verrucomicrobiae bacterium]|nr:DUF1501 domain-containing protein [Verrucomicrobiae bacterium]
MKSSLNRASEVTRRQFAAQTASALLGVGLAPTFANRAFAAREGSHLKQEVATAKRVIYLYMSGGMSHLDTFDVKPGAETMGPTKAINTSADGVQISQYLPKLAKQAHHMAIINSMLSASGAHEQANYLIHTSYALRGTIKHPAIGAWLLKFQDRLNPTLPGNVVIGGGSRHPGGGFFEGKFQPLLVNNPEAGLQNVKARFKDEDFDFRYGLSQELAGDFRNRYQNIKGVRAYSEMYDDAVTLMKSADLAAFDLTQEDDKVRDAYGRNSFGQGCLLARRLVENDVRFVEVTLGSWDTHVSNFLRVPDLCSSLDQGFATLLSDLEQRGLLNDTLVVLSTEFGRTPKINQNVGRDHYPQAFSCVMAGGGIVGGRRFGKSDETGEKVIEDPVTVFDFNATIGYALGLPLDQILYSPSKRPFTVASDGKPATKLFAA